MLFHFTDDSFDEDVLHAQLPVIVDFFAEWCGPCKMMGPTMEELAADLDGKAIVGKLDVDAAPNTAAKFGVQSIPTVIVFHKGVEVARSVGFKDKEFLKTLLPS